MDLRVVVLGGMVGMASMGMGVATMAAHRGDSRLGSHHTCATKGTTDSLAMRRAVDHVALVVVVLLVNNLH